MLQGLDVSKLPLNDMHLSARVNSFSSRLLLEPSLVPNSAGKPLIREVVPYILCNPNYDYSTND